jgi:CDP-diglyceride synthetase
VTFPEGIPVLFSLTRFTGEVQEMNTINHYIGMDPMEKGAPTERRLVPFIYLIFFVSLAVFLFYEGPVWWLFGVGPALMPVYFVGVFSYWLYWFGHNLHEYGAFKIKPFMPTVLGDGKVAQMTTHSYPYVGFYPLLAVLLAMTFAVFIKRRALKELRAANPPRE